MSKIAAMKKAKELYVNQGMTGIDVAKLINVSETHFYRWVRRYGWKDQRENKLMERKIIISGLAVSVEDTLTDFKTFLTIQYPAIAIAVEMPITEYLQSKL